MLAAVRALLRDPVAVAGSMTASCALITAAAKAEYGSLSVPLSVREMGRWIGVTASSIGHDALPTLRDGGLLRTEPLPLDAGGRRTGLRWWPQPLIAARASGDAQHPLALSRRELKVFFRLVEAVFSPGFGSQNPPTVLASRSSGKDAGTDRLALLVLVLLARPSGRVRLISGPLPAGVDRVVATLARELVCPLPEAEAALRRLQAWEQVEWREAGVDGSRARLVVPLVAAAFRTGKSRPVPVAASLPQGGEPDAGEWAPAVGCSCCTGDCADSEGPLAGEGWLQESLDDVPLPATAPGGPADRELPFEESAFSLAVPEPEGVDVDLAGAEFHPSHPPVVEVSSQSSGQFGFSGGAVASSPSALHLDPEHHQLRDRRTAGFGVNPLRGDKPTSLPDAFRSTHGNSAGSYSGAGVVPDYVLAVLAPAQWLWDGLDRAGARQRVTQAITVELEAVRAVLGPCEAELVLAERLASRLDEQRAPIADPVGWLVSRGLPQRRTGCWSAVCDDGVDLGTGQPCAACRARTGERRSSRAAMWREVRAFMPDASAAEVAAEVERRMRDAWSHQSARAAVARQEAEEQVATRARQAAEQAAAVAEALARAQSRACSGCGAADSGGWCGRCADRSAVQVAVEKARCVAAASWLPGDAGPGALELAGEAERLLREAVQIAVERAGNAGGTPEMLAAAARMVAELELSRVRAAAVRHLESSSQATEEAWRAGEAEVQRRRFSSDRASVRAATEEAAAMARERCAQRLLRDGLAEMAASRARSADTACGQGPEPRAPWEQRLALLRDRPLESELLAGAVA